MLTREEETALRQKAQELRERFADSPEYMRLAQQLERAADSGDCVQAAHAATCLITQNLSDEAPIRPKRRFLSG